MSMAMPLRTPAERVLDAERALSLNHLCQYLGSRRCDWVYVDRLREEAQALGRAVEAAREAAHEAAAYDAHHDPTWFGPARPITQAELDALDF